MIVLEILVIAILLADDDVIGEIDLYGSFNEVRVLAVLSFFTHFAWPFS